MEYIPANSEPVAPIALAACSFSSPASLRRLPAATCARAVSANALSAVFTYVAKGFGSAGGAACFLIFLDCGAADASAQPLKSRMEISPRLYPAAAFAMIKAKAVTYVRKCLRCWFMIARLRRYLRLKCAPKEQQQCWANGGGRLAAQAHSGACHVIITRAAPDHAPRHTHAT